MESIHTTSVTNCPWAMTVSAIVAAGSMGGAAYLATSAAAKDAFESLFSTLQSTVSSLKKCMFGEDDALNLRIKLREEALQKKLQAIQEETANTIQVIREETANAIQVIREEQQVTREETAQNLQKIEEDWANMQVEWEERDEARARNLEELDILLQKQNEEELQDFLREMGEEPSSPSDAIETNCALVSLNDFKKMDDFTRIMDERLNPKCCTHAQVMFTRPSDGGLFGKLGELSHRWRELSQVLHPDKHININAVATQAFQRANLAYETLPLCLAKA